MIKQAVKEALVLILAAIAMAFAVYGLRPVKLEFLPDRVNSNTGLRARDKTGFSEISLSEAMHLYQKGDVVFADARPGTDFDAGHIKGARNLYLADQAVWMPALLAATDPGTLIVTYCDGENCHLAAELAEILYFNGFDHVRYLKNGWTRWRESGYPVD